MEDIKENQVNSSGQTEGPSHTTINQLPPELLVEIFGYLSHVEKMSLRWVSKTWYQTLQTPLLWKTVSCERTKQGDHLDARLLCDVVFYAGAGIQAINLRSLKSSWEDYVDNVMKIIPCLPNLESVYLPGLPWMKHVAQVLAALGRHCRRLVRIEGKMVAGLDCSSSLIIRSTNMKVLKLYFYNTIPEEFVKGLPLSFPNLQELSLSSCQVQGIHDDALRALAMSNLRLTRFLFTWNNPTTLEGAKSVAQMTSLKSLSIQFEIFCIDPEIKMIRISEMLQIISEGLDLTELRLRNSKGIPVEAYMTMFGNLPNLKTLSLYRVKMSNECLGQIAACLPSLEEFNVSWWTENCPSEQALDKFIYKCRSTLRAVTMYSWFDTEAFNRLKTAYPHILLRRHLSWPDLPMATSTNWDHPVP